MKVGHMRSIAVLITAIAVSVAASVGVAQVRYDVTDLGTLGSPPSEAYGISSAGAVVGDSSIGVRESHLHPFLWNGGMVDLGAYGNDPHAMAMSINELEQAVGSSFTLGELGTHGVKWENGAIDLLGDFAPRDVNGDCVVVGTQRTQGASGEWVEKAVRWDSGVMTPLGTLGGRHSSAMAINAAGQIVGASVLADDVTHHAAWWDGAIMTDLGTLGGARSQAYDINDVGFVVGAAERSDGLTHAFLFEVDGSGQVMTRFDLGELGGGYSYAYAVNDRGQVVGASDGRPFYYEGGVITDLNLLIDSASGWELTSARTINDAGQIAGRGKISGELRAYLLTPHVEVDCDAIGKLKPKCTDGKLKVKVKSSLPAGTVLTIDANGDQKTLTIDDQGAGKVNFKNRTGAQHVFIVECPQHSKDVTCG